MNSTDLLESAAKVLKREVEGIEALHSLLDDNFLKALQILSNIKGRLVICGMGKSGHIGHKIAATMASTGTPAFFVHPAEASHGDLGMILQDDAILALSNSGETPELMDILGYARRFKIPLIAITSGAQSTLAQAADIAFILPKIPEACPMGLAPTTSTTMTLALGDALAVALLEKRGFTAGDFKVFHPGGKLGKKLLKVTEIMHSNDDMPICHDSDTMHQVVLTISSKRGGCAGIINKDGELVGVITDGDLRRHLSPDLLGKKAAEIMFTTPTTLSPNALVADALALMNEKSVGSIFILDHLKPIGVVHLKDCLRVGAL